jgi:hypothetical protein
MRGTFITAFFSVKQKSYYNTIPHTGWTVITAINPWRIHLPIIMQLIIFLIIVVMLLLMLELHQTGFFQRDLLITSSI